MKKQKVKWRDFYKVYSWQREEFGFSAELGVYALIYSFHENGNPCFYSKDDFADFLKCARSSVYRTIENLIAGGYIKAEKRPAPETTVYRIDEDKAEEMKSNWEDRPKMRPSQNETVLKSDGEPSQNRTGNRPKIGRVTVPKSDTNRVYKREIKEEERERESPHESQSEFIMIPDHEAVKLTAQQYQNLQSDVHGTGRTLESYFRALECAMKSKRKSYEPHNETLRNWIQRDKDERADKAAQQPSTQQQPKRSSIDMSDAYSLINQF